MVTVHQAYILEILYDFKCLRDWHIKELVAQKYNSKPENIDKMIKQLVVMGKIRTTEKYIMLPNRKPEQQVLNAFDVMVTSSAGCAEMFYHGTNPFILMFSVEDTSLKKYNNYGIVIVKPYTENSICSRLQNIDREITVIFILYDTEQRNLIKINNKSYFAIEEENGKYKFFK